MSLRCKDGTLAELRSHLGIERSGVAMTFIALESPKYVLNRARWWRQHNLACKECLWCM